MRLGVVLGRDGSRATQPSRAEDGEPTSAPPRRPLGGGAGRICEERIADLLRIMGHIAPHWKVTKRFPITYTPWGLGIYLVLEHVYSRLQPMRVFWVRDTLL